MLIDWFTVFAQIINFLVLLFLLKRFLYGRIIDAMDKREEKIAARLCVADEKIAEAESEAENYRMKQAELEERRAHMLARAGEEAEALKRELTGRAREETAKLKEDWQESLAREKRSFLDDLRRKTAKEVFSIAGKALRDLSNQELEEHMVEVFLDRLCGLDSRMLKKLRESMQKSREEIAVVSAFEVPAGKRQRITRDIHEHVLKDVEVSYITDPDLLSGIELRAGEYIVGWNLRDYLRGMEREIEGLLKEKTVPEGEEKSE
ncbi:MAG: F0F1 ATP synthase subunit delta [Nitrospirota bacterium]|nr:F0F1 ATP synthase subunit delta [Nitrospirota bacterium]